MSRRDFFEEERKRKMVTTFAVTVALSIVVCVTIFVMYSKKLNDEAQNNLFAVVEDDDIVPNNELAETSYTQDKTLNQTNTTTVELNTTNTALNTVENQTQNTITKEPISSVVAENVTEEKTNEDQNNSENVSTEKEELKFQAPVSGEILKDFAMDTLLYSETLDEWCTHSGIDIKADKSAVVMASEKGTVESIKNDPRYGLTVIISHDNGFKTIYSNLLTTEFVSEGENIEKGQTIGTVGETSSFEIADESHLHFEIHKDGVPVNPTIYF